MSSSVIFIGSPQDGKKSNDSLHYRYTQMFYVPPQELFCRILTSFTPPFRKTYQKIYIDFLGPLLAILVLTLFLYNGHSFKNEKNNLSPITLVLNFAIFMPVLCQFLLKLGRSSINFYQTISLIGYALYGHILMLLTPFIFFDEDSYFYFFICLIVFGGLSTLRLMLIFLQTIPVPGARFLICTTISLLNILYLIFLHFVFLHTTFVYGKDL